MEEINILIVVDTNGTVVDDSLVANSYLVNSNGKCVAWNKRHKRTFTECNDGQIINWAVAPMDPLAKVKIEKFGGELINDGVCNPVIQGISGINYWETRVEAQGNTGNYRYSCELLIDDRLYVYNALLKIQEAS